MNCSFLTFTLRVLLMVQVAFCCISVMASCTCLCVVCMVALTNRKTVSSIASRIIAVHKIRQFPLKNGGVIGRQLFGIALPKDLVGQFDK